MRGCGEHMKGDLLASSRFAFEQRGEGISGIGRVRLVAGAHVLQTLRLAMA